MTNQLHEQLTGYLPLAKFNREFKTNMSLKDTIYSFAKTEQCLIEGKKNLKKLKKIFKNHQIRKSNKNHIFILADNVYLVIANRTNSKVYYIYNEISFDVTQDYFMIEPLNHNKCYHAFNFLNQKIDIIQEYFNTIFQYSIKDNSIEILDAKNIIHNEIRNLIAPHDFKTTHTSPHYELMSDTFYYVNKYALENPMNKSKYNFIFEKNRFYYFKLRIKIDNGTFSVHCTYKDKGRRNTKNCESITSFLDSKKALTVITSYAPLVDTDETETYSFDVYKLETYKKIFLKYKVKERLRKHFEKL